LPPFVSIISTSEDENTLTVKFSPGTGSKVVGMIR
jgi:hypothetical protein